MSGKRQPKNHIKAKKKLSKSKKKFLRGVVYFVFAVFLLSLLFLIGYGIYFLRNDEKFNITSIEVNELDNYTSEEVILASGVELNTNIFKLSKKDVVSSVKTLPYVKSVTVTKKLPSTILINIEERVEKYTAYAKDSGEYVRLDSEGYVLEIIDVATLSESLILFGLNFEDVVELGYKLTDIELEKLNSLEKIIEIYSQNQITDKITSVEFKNSYVYLNINDKLSVKLKDNSELEYKIALLKEILKEIDGKTGALDMTQENPIYSAI